MNEASNRFIAAVASGRRVSESIVRTRFGQGRMVGAREAVQRGFAYRVATLHETINITSQVAASGRASGERAYIDRTLMIARGQQRLAGIAPRSHGSERADVETQLRRARLRQARVLTASSDKVR